MYTLWYSYDGHGNCLLQGAIGEPGTRGRPGPKGEKGVQGGTGPPGQKGVVVSND